MKQWLKKYFRAVHKDQALSEITEHLMLIERTNEALRRYEKASLDGEEHWLECELVEAKFKKGAKDGTLTGAARVNCYS